MKPNRGFTLVELMVVIAIVATLAALATSSLLRSRMNANEMAAIGGLRVIATGTQNYYARVTPHTYPDSLEDLGPDGSDPPYIDGLLAAGEKQGYTFVYELEDEENYTCRANPSTPGRTGNRYFYVDEEGRITANATEEAGPDDPYIE